MATPKPPAKIFPITTLISDLPPNLVPQAFAPSSQDGSAAGRLVIVGDVHGMRKSLEALLEKVNFDKSKGDHLMFVGDLVNKGQDSPGVIDLAIKLGASAVRGNHENAVLNAAAGINATRDPSDPKDIPIRSAEQPKNPESIQPANTSLPETSEKSVYIPSPETQSTASTLSTHHINWLASLPLILRIKLPQTLKSSLGDTLLVAHAGLVPNIPLEEQDPHAIMHIRSLTRPPEGGGFVPSEASGEEGWVKEWDRWQDGLPSRSTVIFGHDAKRRLQLGKYTIGLDSGCLYGNQLSAVVISASDGVVRHEVIQVECADEPVAPTISAK